MFDSHCHLDFNEFDDDHDAVLERARASGVRAVHVPGVGPDQWARAAALADREGLGCGVGIHPQWVAQLDDEGLEAALADLAPRARALGAEAIGECGLDGAVAKRQPRASLERQIAVLDAHLETARQIDLPIVLHVFKAHGQALEVLGRHGPLPAGGAMHSYSGPAEMVDAYAALGLCFGFAAPITRDQARRPLEAARAVPADRLLLESDGPYQKLTGRDRGSPEDLPAICAAVAAARGDSAEAIATLTHDNAARLFRRR